MVDSNSSECLVSVTLKSSRFNCSKIVLPFIVSVCVGFSLAAVLHVEGKNVYYPKNINHSGVQRGPSLFSAEADLNSSSQGCGSLRLSRRASTVSIGNRSAAQVSPSSRMHVMFHSC